MGLHRAYTEEQLLSYFRIAVLLTNEGKYFYFALGQDLIHLFIFDRDRMAEILLCIQVY